MHYDIAIVGGGLVGAGLAAALRTTNLSVALIDARLPTNSDPRLFALNSTSIEFLKNINIFPALKAHASPIFEVHVSHRGSFGAVRLKRDDAHLEALGYVIPAFHIETAMNELMAALDHVTLYRPALLQSMEQQNDDVALTLATDQGDEHIHATLVIGADGTDSTVRAKAHIKATIHDYHQSAMVTKTSLKRSHEHIAYERFVADGAIAMLPLSPHECATIVTVNNQKMAELAAFSDDAFLSYLQETFGYRLGRFECIAKRHVFPLKMVRAEKSFEKNVLLLGNALQTMHPIAAQGFNLALYEVAILAEFLIEKWQQNETYQPADLQKISERIESQQSLSMGVSHRLSTLFTEESKWMSLMTSLGMLSLDLLKPVKRTFVNKMMGQRGSVPRLLLRSNE